MSKAQERTREAVELLRSWQSLEREAIATTAVVAKVLLEYLTLDEQKHDTLLGHLEAVKRHLSKLA